jgi:hypothetical protein
VNRSYCLPPGSTLGARPFHATAVEFMSAQNEIVVATSNASLLLWKVESSGQLSYTGDVLTIDTLVRDIPPGSFVPNTAHDGGAPLWRCG